MIRFIRAALAIVLLLAVSSPVWAQPTPEQRAARERQAQEDLVAERPIAAVNSLWIEELTWMEVRDQIAAGYTTAIIPTGGIEANGPYVATGKHNVILEGLCPAIAEKLGDALCAPIVGFVPEGAIDPPSGGMRFPGTISVRDETYAALLDDIASSLRAHGFENIVFIGDSGGNQRGMRAVAETLNERWSDSRGTAHFIEEFYSPGWEATEDYTEEVLGVAEGESDGYHDDIWVTALMMVTDPTSVRYDQRVDAGLASINGVSIESLDETILLGRQMMDFRAEFTVRAIREAIANAGGGD
jgi:creatinine amidohydrolase/Fe(II)-dependent formamide hydrolase-like protein